MKNIVSLILILFAFDISSNAQNVDLSSVDEPNPAETAGHRVDGSGPSELHH